MDNYTDDIDNDEIETDESSIKSLRKAASRSKKLEQELNQMQRELAFFKAGIPQDDPRMRYFIKGYDGELEAEAIRQAAVQAGFLQVQTSPEQAQVQEAIAAEGRVMAASAGAVAEDNSEGAALARLEAALNEGGVEAMLDVARQYGVPTTHDG